MAKKTSPRVVGIFILGAVALLVAAVVVFGGGLLFQQESRAVAYFQGSVAGLSIGAPVNFRGVRIGSVSNVVLEVKAETGDAQIPVYLQFDRSRFTLIGGTKLAPATQREMIERGLRAQLVSQSFVTGQLAVELDYFPGTPINLVGADHDVPEIPTVPSRLQEVQNALSQLPLQDIAQTALHVLTAADTLLRSPELQATVSGAAGSMGELQGLLTEARPEIVSALRNVGDAAADIRQVTVDAQAHLERIRDQVSTALVSLTRLLDHGDQQLGSTAAALRTTAQDLDATLAQAQTTLTNLNGMLGQRAPLRQDLETTMRNLSAASASLRGLASTLERNPNALLLGRPRQ